MATATVYTKPNCPQCEDTKNLLTSLGVEFTTEPITPANIKEFKERGHRQAPIVVTSDGDEWSGFQPDKIKSLTGQDPEENPWNF